MKLNQQELLPWILGPDTEFAYQSLQYALVESEQDIIVSGAHDIGKSHLISWLCHSNRIAIEVYDPNTLPVLRPPVNSRWLLETVQLPASDEHWISVSKAIHIQVPHPSYERCLGIVHDMFARAGTVYEPNVPEILAALGEHGLRTLVGATKRAIETSILTRNKLDMALTQEVLWKYDPGLCK